MLAVHYHDRMFPPEQRLDWESLLPLIGPAHGAVARYDGMVAAVGNRGVLLASLATREAVLSSRIEGMQATMGEVLEYEAGRRPSSKERSRHLGEVLNCQAATRKAEEMLEELPISRRVILAAHQVLLSGARGSGMAPGEFRRIPNWIGPPGCSAEDATYVPIGADRLEDAMDRWESYIRSDTPDRLVQAGILHAEFEALHPFLDGNGRLGRMLVPLYLWQRGITRRPVLNVSAQFEAKRDEYYERLLAVSRDDDWTGWCRFFLEAVHDQAVDSLAKARRILDLYGRLRDRIPNATRSRHAIRALDWIFSRPVFAGSEFAKGTELPGSTANRILHQLRSTGIVTEIRAGSGTWPAILACPELLSIVEDTETP